MAQEYNEILPSGSTNILQDNIDSRKNDEALRSGFSGSAFPTSPVPVAGQRCYREDLKKEYIFNGEGWVEVASSGAIAQEVALARGTHAELQDRLGVSMNPDGTLKTPATANIDEFKVSGLEPTYVSTNSFSVPGDVRAIFTENRRLKITQGAETIYPAVVSSSYDNEADKTTIVIDGITITTEITAVNFSMVQNGLPANLNAATLNGKSDTAFQEVSQKDQPGGYAGLDTSGKIADSAGAMPTGVVAYFSKNSPPDGWMKCNGAEISRTTYSGLFSAIGTVFGAGDGSTTFQLPDLRGEFLRGLDDGRGVDGGRVLGSEQLDAMQGHWHSRHGVSTGSEPGPNGHNSNGTFVDYPFVGDPITDGEHGEPRIASETRPRNIALLACIKY